MSPDVALPGLSPVDPAGIVAWVAGEENRPTGLPDDLELPWLLAYLDDGVVWGRQEKTRWACSSGRWGSLSPELRVGALQELRLFGPHGEALVWAEERGNLSGRLLADSAANGWEEGCEPMSGSFLILADRCLAGPDPQGFTLVGDGAGSRQVVPVAAPASFFRGGRWPLALAVRRYLAADRETGAVRVAASRLCDLLVNGQPASRAVGSDALTEEKAL